MDLNKTNQILRVSKMYYEEHMSQQKIANIEEISIATVSRLLKKAEELGFIKITIVQPFFSTADLESELKRKYGLKKVTVIPDLIQNNNALIRDLNRILLEDLNKLVQDGDTVGFAWGHTLTSLAQDADDRSPFDKKDVQIVQLYGGITPLLHGSGSTEIVQSMSRLFQADGYQICAPAYVDKKETAELLKNESQIQMILEKGRNCNVAVFSAGLLEKDGFVFSLGNLKEEDLKYLEDHQAVGDICLHFLDKNGEIASQEIDNRTVALTLNEIKKIPEKLLIAYGKQKAPIINAILKKGIADRLYIDEDLAKTLLS